MSYIPAAFAYGFVGSLHCLGMCGPIVAALSLPAGSNTGTASLGAPTGGFAWTLRTLASHGGYHLGRIVTYTGLGFVAGGLGEIAGRRASLMGLQRWFSLVLGLAMIVMGLWIMGAIPTPRVLVTAWPGLTRLATRRLADPRPLSRLGLGLLLGFLPCGLVYGALLQAAATASWWQGGLVLTAFGLGTVPALLALGFVSSLATSPLRRWWDRLAGATLIILGIILALHFFGIRIGPTPHCCGEG